MKTVSLWVPGFVLFWLCVCFVFIFFFNLKQKALFTVSYLDEIPSLPFSSRVYSIEFVVQS